MILPWKLLFFFLLIAGSLVTMSASSWFVAWMGLEVNMLSFLALALERSSPRNSESILKYFLVQALASAVLIASAMMSKFYDLFSSINILITLSLMLKLGAAPFHFWVPQILVGCSWVNLFIILSWQKVAPFFLVVSLLPFLSFKWKLMMILIILSALMGVWGGLSQSLISKILAFSSINHMGWMLTAVLINFSKWIVYFVSYVILLLAVVQYTFLFNMTTLNSSISLSESNKIFFFISLFSFGGLPPFFGFLPKWVILEQIAEWSTMIPVILVLSSLFILFFYLRLAFNSFLRKNVMYIKPNSSHTSMKILSVINIFGLTSVSFV